MLKNVVVLVIMLILLFCCCKGRAQTDSETAGGEKMEIKVTSSAFAEGGLIPAKYTCDGSDISPPLQWEAVPEGTKSIALISDDPDAPMGTWVHWVLFNLPAESKGLEENIPSDKTLPNGARQGLTDFGRVGYGGPCPPSGTHRYFFKVYALDMKLDLAAGAKKSELLKAMEGHILGQGQLIGKYKRQ
jgi:Raf kinase inhibitor-like YbhB/YbcL family protein